MNKLFEAFFIFYETDKLNEWLTRAFFAESGDYVIFIMNFLQ